MLGPVTLSFVHWVLFFMKICLLEDTLKAMQKQALSSVFLWMRTYESLESILCATENPLYNFESFLLHAKYSMRV